MDLTGVLNFVLDILSLGLCVVVVQVPVQFNVLLDLSRMDVLIAAVVVVGLIVGRKVTQPICSFNGWGYPRILNNSTVFPLD